MLIAHSTFINCSTQKVWEATTDIDSWPEWAPTVQTARRLDRKQFGVGSQASIKQPMQSRAIWTVTEFENGQHFAWENSGKAIRMRATHRVSTHNDGTNCNLEVKLIGPAAVIFGVFLAPFIWAALVLENRGLKRWCETSQTPSASPQDHRLRQSSSAIEQISGSAKLTKG